MKRKCFVITLVLSLFSFINVYAACGELKNVDVSPGKITSHEGKYYNVTAPSGTKKVTISADLINKKESFVNGKAPGTYNVPANIGLEVTCESGGHVSVFFNVTVESKPKNNSNNNSQTSNNTKQTESKAAESVQESKVESVESTPPPTPYLKGLEVKGYTVDFKKDVTKYEIIEEKNVKKLEITATGENDTDKVMISSNANNIKTGTNNITVTVTNSEGGKNVYTIKFVKTYKESSDASLKSLKVKGYDIEFDKDTYVYNLNYKGDTKLDITTAASDSKSKVEVNGNENLKNGSEVTIDVTAEDGTKQSYKLILEKKFDFQRYASYIIAGALIIFLSFLILLFKPKKKKKAKKEVKETPKEEVKEEAPEPAPAEPEPVQEQQVDFQIPTEKAETTVKKEQEYAEVKPNENEVNVDDHLKIVNPTDVDESSNEESSKTEVFKF